MYGQFSKRWGEQKQQVDSLDLLAKKDQQIRRLQAELQQQRRRADNALKMLDSHKSVNKQTQQSSQGLRNEMTRRIKAEQQVKRLKIKNVTILQIQQELQNGIRQLMKSLQRKLNQKKQKQSSCAQEIQED